MVYRRCFQPQGDENTVRRQLSSSAVTKAGSNFIFHDYEPHAFRRIREIYDISNEDYRLAFSSVRARRGACTRASDPRSSLVARFAVLDQRVLQQFLHCAGAHWASAPRLHRPTVVQHVGACFDL